MSVTPGPIGDAVLDPERPFRGRARVEDRVHVPDQQDPRAVGAAAERRHKRGPQDARWVGTRLDLRAEVGQEGGDPAADRVDARPACSCRSRC